LLELLIRQMDDGLPIVAVGTTSARTLESLYWLGLQLKSNPQPRIFNIRQWEPYEEKAPISVMNALKNILQFMETNQEEEISGYTGVIIVPGYPFRVIDGLVTNFHQPGSTLLLLIAAFIGDFWREVYEYALKNDFRFLSYGDASLLWRQSS